MKTATRTATRNTTISLGKPITVPCLIPVLHASTPKCINEPFIVNGKCYKVTAISFGTPHGAVMVDDLDSVDVESVGSALGNHQLFPEGASIVFIEALDMETVRARLWKHGVGEVDFTPEAVGVAATVSRMLNKTTSYKTGVIMSDYIFSVEWDWISDVRLTKPADVVQYMAYASGA